MSGFRVVELRRIRSESTIKSGQGHEIFRSLMTDSGREESWVVVLDHEYNILGASQISIGDADRCLAGPREIFRVALLLGGSKIAVAHSHVDTGAVPSVEDQEQHNRLYEVGAMLGIRVLPSFVIAMGSKEYSLIQYRPNQTAPGECPDQLG